MHHRRFTGVNSTLWKNRNDSAATKSTDNGPHSRRVSARPIKWKCIQQPVYRCDDSVLKDFSRTHKIKQAWDVPNE
jgi:hypothetical protein